jgi:hypothetical protein
MTVCILIAAVNHPDGEEVSHRRIPFKEGHRGGPGNPGFHQAKEEFVPAIGSNLKDGLRRQVSICGYECSLANRVIHLSEKQFCCLLNLKNRFPVEAVLDACIPFLPYRRQGSAKSLDGVVNVHHVVRAIGMVALMVNQHLWAENNPVTTR